MKGFWDFLKKIILNKLGFDVKIDLLAYQNTAGFEGLVPFHIPVMTVDFTFQNNRNAIVAPGIFHHAAVFCVQFYGLGNSIEGQITLDGIFTISFFLYSGRFKVNTGIFFAMKEILALQMLVPVFIVSRDGLGFCIEKQF